uniref:Uncharacterized protein n=1 Tax=Timema genevievae TaxID=629358 RepID=A0A7R9PJJ3_TIMGE|nr:unnamed protein product [Timema genevievae]
MCLYYRSRPFSARALLGHALLHRPAGVGVAPWSAGSHVYVAGTDNNQVLVFDLTKGKLLQRLTAPNMKCPQGLTFCPHRMEIYVTDKWSHCIHVFDKDGRFLRKLCFKGHGEGQLRSPEGISLGPDPANQEGALLYVCDTGNDRVQILNPDNGSFINQIGIIGGEKGRINKSLLTEFNQPTGVAVSKDRIVVIDFGNRRVKLFTLAGEKVKEFGAMGSSGGQFLSPECVAVDPLGFILVGDSGNARVQIFQPDGALVRVFGKRGAGPGKIRWVSGLHVTPDMDIIVTDFKNHCMQIF